MPTTNAGATLMLQPMRGALVAAATKYLALYDGNPDSGGTEVTGTGYARLERSTTQISITNNELSVSAWENGTTAPTCQLGNAGLRCPDVSYLTGGNVLFYGLLSPALTEIVAGTRVFTNTGDITFTIPLS